MTRFVFCIFIHFLSSQTVVGLFYNKFVDRCWKCASSYVFWDPFWSPLTWSVVSCLSAWRPLSSARRLLSFLLRLSFLVSCLASFCLSCPGPVPLLSVSFSSGPVLSPLPCSCPVLSVSSSRASPVVGTLRFCVLFVRLSFMFRSSYHLNYRPG